MTTSVILPELKKQKEKKEKKRKARPNVTFQFIYVAKISSGWHSLNKASEDSYSCQATITAWPPSQVCPRSPSLRCQDTYHPRWGAEQDPSSLQIRRQHWSLHLTAACWGCRPMAVWARSMESQGGQAADLPGGRLFLLCSWWFGRLCSASKRKKPYDLSAGRTNTGTSTQEERAGEIRQEWQAEGQTRRLADSRNEVWELELRRKRVQGQTGWIKTRGEMEMRGNSWDQ